MHHPVSVRSGRDRQASSLAAVRAALLGLAATLVGLTPACARSCREAFFDESGSVVIVVPVPPGTAAPVATICVDIYCGSTTDTGTTTVSQYDGTYTLRVPRGSDVLKPSTVLVTLRLASQPPVEASLKASPRREEPNGKGCEPTLRVVRLTLDAATKTLAPTKV